MGVYGYIRRVLTPVLSIWNERLKYANCRIFPIPSGELKGKIHWYLVFQYG